jgi:hypothetical protein
MLIQCRGRRSRRRIAGSTYRGIGLRSWANYRKMSSHLRLAQNDKRKSEDDGRGDHGSELGKYRPESARSELQCLAPCSPTKIFHVGLHAATSCRAPQPAPAPQSGGSMQGNNSPVNKRTVRPRRKIGAWHAVAAARRSTRRRVSAVVFWLARWRAPGPGGKLTTPIFDRSRARPHPPRRLSSFIGLYRPLPTRLAATLEGSA